MTSDIKTPPIGDWDSHLPMLYHILRSYSSAINGGSVTEFGCGLGSTPFLTELCDILHMEFDYFETNKEWFNKVEDHLSTLELHPYSWLIKDYMRVKSVGKILFVDCAPGDLRKKIISKFANCCDIIIVHDSQPSAEYVYGLKNILSSFKSRLDTHIDQLPSTTAVSNFINLSNWRGDHAGVKFT